MNDTEQRALLGLCLSLLSQARGLQQQYLPQIQERSRGLSLAEVARMAGR